MHGEDDQWGHSSIAAPAASAPVCFFSLFNFTFSNTIIAVMLSLLRFLRHKSRSASATSPGFSLLPKRLQTKLT